MALRRSSILIPLIVACAMFMEHLDSSILSTALPSIAKSLHTEPQRLSLAITSYLLSLAAFIPLSGWIADRFGARTVFCTAIALFTISSIGCGLSTDLTQLVIGRVLQGFAGAMMVPVGRLVLFRNVPKAELVNALAWLTFPALTAPIFGPLVGGFIVTYLPWNWVFFVNVPIGILGMILVMTFIENTKEENQKPLDWRGFFITATALACLVFGFETIGRPVVSQTLAIGLLVISAIGFGLYSLHVRTTDHPILDLSLFRIPTFGIATIGGTLFRICIGALPFLTPLMLQVGFHLSPLRSGFLTFAGAIGTVLMKLLAGTIIRLYGFRRVLIINTAVCALSIFAYAFFDPETPHIVIFCVLLFGGFFRSLQFTGLNALGFADISQPRMSAATSLYSMMQQLSFSLGVGFAALSLQLTQLWTGHAELGPYDFWPTLLFFGFLSMAPLPSFFKLSDNAGAEVSGHLPVEDDEEGVGTSA